MAVSNSAGHNPARSIGASFIGASRDLGSTAILLGQVLGRSRRGSFEFGEYLRLTHKMGYRSVGLIAATAVVVGIILVIQAFSFVERYGLRSQLGWGSGFVIIRELGPVLFALMFSGRVGAFTAAELGTMRVTDQIDGLKCLAIDPVSYLVVPRFWAMITSLSLLTIIGNAAALLTAAIFGQIMMDVEQHTFWRGLSDMLGPWDFFTGVFKAASFGVIIAVTSCHHGLTTTGGAQGVGISVNRAVVSSAIMIFLVDYFSTFALG